MVFQMFQSNSSSRIIEYKLDNKKIQGQLFWFDGRAVVQNISSCFSTFMVFNQDFLEQTRFEVFLIAVSILKTGFTPTHPPIHPPIISINLAIYLAK